MISGILSGSMPDRATYAIAVPVQNEGEVVYLLSFLAPVNRLQGILSREYVQGWMTGVSDRDGIALARIPDPASIVGRPRLATLRQRQTDTPGVWEGKDFNMRPVTVVEARSRLTGWTVSAVIPKALVDARLRGWIWAFTGFGLLVLATSSILAINLWSKVSQPLRRARGVRPGARPWRSNSAHHLADPRDPPPRRRSGGRISAPAHAKRRARYGARRDGARALGPARERGAVPAHGGFGPRIDLDDRRAWRDQLRQPAFRPSVRKTRQRAGGRRVADDRPFRTTRRRSRPSSPRPLPSVFP